MAGDEFCNSWGFDADGYEHRNRCTEIIACPTCESSIRLNQCTEEWARQAGGNHIHLRYGPAMGTCCGVLFVDHGGVIQMYELPEFPDPDYVPGTLPNIPVNVPMPAVRMPAGGPIVGRVYERPLEQNKKTNLLDWLRLLFG